LSGAAILIPLDKPAGGRDSPVVMETPPQDAQSTFPPPTGLSLASLLLGIGAIGLSFLLVGFLLGAVGLALGIAYLAKKRGPTAMARWGIGLSVLGMLASIGFAALYLHYYRFFSSNLAGTNAVSTAALANPPPLPASSPLLNSSLIWSDTISGAQALCIGDWENDASSRILVAASKTLHVLDLTGVEKSKLPLPDYFTTIECGRSKTAGARLLAYKSWGPQVSVLDHTGKLLWNQSGGMGVDGAHWGDLHGDGNDEMILGMNGFSGLEALSSDGKKLWSANLANVWSQAIVPATSNRPPMVLATDASGSITMFDAAGHRQNSLRPEGGYYAEMAAAVMESNALQIIAFSGSAVAAFDQTGKVAWTTSALSNQSTVGTGAGVATGDFKGDGTQQWAFIDGAGDLVIATSGGLKVSSITNQSSIQGLAAAPRQGLGALLITLDAGVVRAYSFAP
jgi:hypothetical protein